MKHNVKSQLNVLTWETLRFDVGVSLKRKKKKAFPRSKPQKHQQSVLYRVLKTEMSQLQIPRYRKASLSDDGTSPSVKFKVTDGNRIHAWWEAFMMYKPESQHKFGQKIAKALHKPKQVFGYDPCEYGFYYNHFSTEEEIKSVKKNMFSTHKFEFPPFKINLESKPRQKYVYDKLCEGYYNEWEKYQRSFHSANGFDGDSEVVPGDFNRCLGNYYARGIEFMRNLQFLYPDVVLQQVWDLAWN